MGLFTNGSTAVTNLTVDQVVIDSLANGGRILVGQDPVIADVAVASTQDGDIVLVDPWSFVTGTYAITVSALNKDIDNNYIPTPPPPGAEIDYPDFLPMPTDSGFNRNESAQWLESDPQSGPLYKIRRTFDTPTTMNLRFVMDKGKARLFRQWYVEKTDYGLRSFNIKLPSESGVVTQEAEFTRDGRPTLSEIRGTAHTFTAQVYIRALADPDFGEYDTLEYLVQNSPCGQGNYGANLLDIAVNEDLPEA